MNAFLGREKTAYKLEHYIGLFGRKPRSVFQAKTGPADHKKEIAN